MLVVRIFLGSKTFSDFSLVASTDSGFASLEDEANAHPSQAETACQRAEMEQLVAIAAPFSVACCNVNLLANSCARYV